MPTTFRIFLVFVLFISSVNTKVFAETSIKQGIAVDIVGTWFLQAIEVMNDAGEWEPDEQLGRDPFGILMYDRAGNMAVQIVRRDRTIADADNVVEEIVNGYVAYAGRYETDEVRRTVTHHRIVHVNPDLHNMSVVRSVKFTGERMILSVAPDEKLRLVWGRRQ